MTDRLAIDFRFLRDPAFPKVLTALAVWGAVVSIASIFGLTAALPSKAFTALVFLSVAGAMAAIFLSRDLRRLSEQLGPYGLASFHVWRIAAALVFFRYGAVGLLPESFVSRAATGDLIAGALAATIFLLPRRAAIVSGFHLIGFADFVIAVGTGVSMTAAGNPEIANITHFPLALIPLFGVPISGATHLAAFRLLLRRRETAAA